MQSETIEEARRRYMLDRAGAGKGYTVLVWAPEEESYKIVRRAEFEKEPEAVGCRGGHVVMSVSRWAARRLVAEAELPMFGRDK